MARVPSCVASTRMLSFEMASPNGATLKMVHICTIFCVCANKTGHQMQITVHVEAYEHLWLS